MGIFSKGVVKSWGFIKSGKLPEAVLQFVSNSYENLNNFEKAKVQGSTVPRNSFNNAYLIDSMKRLHYTLGNHYTINEKGSACNLYLASGTLLISTASGSSESNKIESLNMRFNKSKINNTVDLFSHQIISRQDLDTIIGKLIVSGIRINIIKS